jgi:hypothetical protein
LKWLSVSSLAVSVAWVVEEGVVLEGAKGDLMLIVVLYV